MIALLDTDAALFALHQEWTALWSRVPDASPFAHPAWLLPWWRQFGTGAPLVATERMDGRLVAVLPMYALDGRALPIGAGNTDQHDILAEPGRDPMPLLDAVRARGPCELLEVPPHARLRAVPGAWSESSPCPVMTLPATVDGLPATVPARTLRKLRMNRNRAARLGGVKVVAATAETVPAMLDDLMRLHQSRWVGQGEAGSFADPLITAFHRESAPLLLAAGVLRLQALQVDGATAAVIYALTPVQGRILFYLSGFDAAFGDISPGSLLLAAMLEQAIGEGRAEADFLRGTESYKYAWGAVDRLNGCCRFDGGAGNYRPSF